MRCAGQYVMLMTWKKAAAGEIHLQQVPPMPQVRGQVALPAGPPLTPPPPTPHHPCCFFKALKPHRTLHPEVWSGWVSLTSTSSLCPVPLQALPARRCLSSVPRVWPIGAAQAPLHLPWYATSSVSEIAPCPTGLQAIPRVCPRLWWRVERSLILTHACA